MAMGRLATRRFAVDAPYSWFAFAEPFASPGGHIGRHFFRDFARETGAALTPSAPHAGLVPAFRALRSDSFDPGQVDPLIVDFYEHTADFAMKVDGAFTPLFEGPASVLYRPLASLVEQLDVPDFQPGVTRDMVSQFGFIEPAQASPSRIWIRSMKDTGAIFYVGAVHDSIAETNGRRHAYITMVFPLPRANLAVMLKLENAGGDGFRMTTDPEGPTDAGTYLVRPGPTTVSWIEVPGAKEEFTFGVTTLGGRRCIVGQHDAYWLGQKAFSLTYHIAPSVEAAAVSGMESFHEGAPLPPLGEGFFSIGALRAAPGAGGGGRGG
jgi:hypothetical protein